MCFVSSIDGVAAGVDINGLSGHAAGGIGTQESAEVGNFLQADQTTEGRFLNVVLHQVIKGFDA
jgi:hypothetical protein